MNKVFARLRVVWFWVVAFSVIIWNVSKGNTWSMVMADFDVGNGKRKRLVAKRVVGGLHVYWERRGE